MKKDDFDKKYAEYRAAKSKQYDGLSLGILVGFLVVFGVFAKSTDTDCSAQDKIENVKSVRDSMAHTVSYQTVQRDRILQMMPTQMVK